MAGEAPRAPRATRRERRTYETEFARIVAFSDGVFAIAITLLVLSLEVPDVPDEDLARALSQDWPHLLAYGLSFAVVGRFWLVHHSFFSTLTGFDSTLMTSNLVYLGLIVLVPFASDVLGEYGNTATAVVIYGGTLGAAGLLNWLMIRYALRGDLIVHERLPSTEPFGQAGALIIPGVFLLSIPVAILIDPLVGELLWFGAFAAVRTVRRRGVR
jgi:uncharacterized membrane protein